MGASIDHLSWRRSSRCNNGACVEWASDDDTVYMRDSKSAGGPVLSISRDQWRDFVDAIKRDAFAES